MTSESLKVDNVSPRQPPAAIAWGEASRLAGPVMKHCVTRSRRLGWRATKSPPRRCREKPGKVKIYQQDNGGFIDSYAESIDSTGDQALDKKIQDIIVKTKRAMKVAEKSENQIDEVD